MGVLPQHLINKSKEVPTFFKCLECRAEFFGAIKIDTEELGKNGIRHSFIIGRPSKRWNVCKFEIDSCKFHRENSMMPYKSHSIERWIYETFGLKKRPFER